MYPDDAELLFQEGIVRRELADRIGVEACFLQLLRHKAGNHFASIDTGIHGYKTRHNLGIVYYEGKKLSDAEAQWRAAVAEKPDFIPARLGLGDIFLAQERWGELEELLTRLQNHPQAWVDAEVFQARVLLARKEFKLAKERLEHVIEKAPTAIGPRIFLSHVFLQEGRDWKAAERALRDVLALDPDHKEARQNLEVLLRERGRSSASK